MNRPLARTEGLVTERVDDQLVVYDEIARTAHSLARDAASVWERCDGQLSAAEIADALALDRVVVDRAVAELSACGLLDELPSGAPGYSRREATAKLAKLGGIAFTAPLIYSVAIPSAAAAASDKCTGVTCIPQDQCHSAGTCNPSTGTCSNPPVLNDTPCNDGNACTQNDVCLAGVCTGTAPVVCTPLDECHVAGTCNPGTGLCSNPVGNNGAQCNGRSGICENGVCQPT